MALFDGAAIVAALGSRSRLVFDRHFVLWLVVVSFVVSVGSILRNWYMLLLVARPEHMETKASFWVCT